VTVAESIEAPFTGAVITGGSGFIGTHLTHRLKQNNIRVAIIDRRPPASRQVDLYIKGSIEDESTWMRLANELHFDVDALFHLAARTSVLESISDPHDVFRSNLVGFENALEFCRLNSIERVAFASTNAVVGSGTTDTITEVAPLAPLTPYGATKAAGEMLGSAYASSYGIAVGSIRLTNVYGPAMWHKDSIVPRLFRHAVGLSDFAVYGSGNQFRDFVFVEDVVEAFIAVVAQKHSGPVSFGSGESVTVNELVELVSEVTGISMKPRHVPPKAGEMPGVRISLDLAHEMGLKATTGLETGLKVAWDSFQEEHGLAVG
jgi:UDP-glucose 4-epimerase